MNLKFLFGDISDLPDQLLIIGIVQYDPSQVDEEFVQRKNSEMTKLVPIKRPGKEGKKAIFDTYLKKYREKNLLEESVTSDALVKMLRNDSQTFISLEGISKNSSMKQKCMPCKEWLKQALIPLKRLKTPGAK
ncbi:MAG: hypothetical protein WB791_08870 [Waddliaceae bacterium]